MPMNIVIDRHTIATSVAAALLLSGGRNAGTPLETASTPVSAVHPFENAVSSTKSGSSVVPGGRGAAGGGTGCSVPLTYRNAPNAIIARMLTMKKYVGPAKI